MTRWLITLTLTASTALLATSEARQSRTGVLLLAHGGAAAWNERVMSVARDIDKEHATETAFGMASRASLQSALDRLAARGVTDVIAVPLFVSSHSSVITSTEFLLGLRAEAPKDLAIFAKMDHTRHGAPASAAPATVAADPHAAHAAHAAAPDPASPVTTRLPVRLAPAFNRHALIGAILADRAKSISTAPAQEAVLLVAHGPVPDDDNRRWLEDMAVLAGAVQAATPYAAVEYLTVRDDAGPAMREQATQELRALVTKHASQGRRVLIVPHLVSFGGIEQGIRKRLEGLTFTMADQGLMPDPRIGEWVRASVRAAGER